MITLPEALVETAQNNRERSRAEEAAWLLAGNNAGVPLPS